MSITQAINANYVNQSKPNILKMQKVEENGSAEKHEVMSVQVLERIKETVNKNARNMTDREKTRKQQIKRDDNDDNGNGHR